MHRLLAPGLVLLLLASPVEAKAPPLSAARAAGLEFVEEPWALPELAFAELVRGGASAERRFADFDGRVVVVVFWATWCGICAREIPQLDLLQREFGGDGLEVVAISTDGRAELVPLYFGKRGVKNLRAFHDTGGRMATRLGVDAVPSTLIADRDGNIVFSAQGPVAWRTRAAHDVLRHYLGTGWGGCT